MKKLILSLALGLGVLSTMPALSATSTFSTSQMAQVQLSDLSFKEIMRKFYTGQMGYVFVDDESIEEMPHIGLGQEDSEGDKTVAAMHPVIPYHNAAGEPRYLVIIEKVKVFADSGTLVSCHACTATADLYSFKKLHNGSYQLVSTTPKAPVDFSASWGRVQLSGEDIQQGMQPLGKDLIGSVFMNGYVSTGEMSSWWEVLHLPENDYINLYTLGDAGSDNGGNHEEDSPLHYGYEGIYKVMPNNSQYYPIKLTYQGDKPTDDYEQIIPVNYSVIKSFNPTKKAYQ